MQILWVSMKMGTYLQMQTLVIILKSVLKLTDTKNTYIVINLESFMFISPKIFKSKIDLKILWFIKKNLLLFAIFKLFCSSNVSDSLADVSTLDPVFKYYQPHEGELLGIRFSPNRKDMFMSYGTDGEIRIYMVGEVCIIKKTLHLLLHYILY